MLATIGKGDAVISAKLDRAFRSAADALAVLEELKDQGISLHLIDLGGDVTGNGMSKMVFTILAAVAEGERDRIRERIRDAKRHLTSQGVFSGGLRPFGYDKVQDGEIVRLVPNPAETAVIERMQTMRRDGATYRAIGAVTGHGPRAQISSTDLRAHGASLIRAPWPRSRAGQERRRHGVSPWLRGPESGGWS
jgi:putative DNA-invertase from lambdoid prophage Rac